MMTEFPLMLACAFLASAVLGAAKTSRWKAVLLCLIVVPAMSLGPDAIDQLMARTVEGYLWFSLFAAAVCIPTLVVSAVGADLGATLMNFFAAGKANDNEEVAE